MNSSAEATIDTSLSHHMEDRVLAIALKKAAAPVQREGSEPLAALRQGLAQRRASFLLQAVASRQAEAIATARVDAIAEARFRPELRRQQCQAPGARCSTRRATVSVLSQVNDVLLKLDTLGGRTRFEIDL